MAGLARSCQFDQRFDYCRFDHSGARRTSEAKKKIEAKIPYSVLNQEAHGSSQWGHYEDSPRQRLAV
jgi:hypothetical protein